jgi:hypothetical protein
MNSNIIRIYSSNKSMGTKLKIKLNIIIKKDKRYTLSKVLLFYSVVQM